MPDKIAPKLRVIDNPWFGVEGPRALADRAFSLAEKIPNPGDAFGAFVLMAALDNLDAASNNLALLEDIMKRP